MFSDISVLIMGIFAMLIMALSIIFFVLMYQRRVLEYDAKLKLIEQKRKEELVNAIIESEEQERMRIASELHDDVGASLSAISLLVSSYLKNKQDISLIEDIKELLGSTIKTIRSLSHKLHPAMLKRLGLSNAISNFMNIIGNKSDIKVNCYCHDITLPRFSDKIEMNVYRIIMETVNNIIKHSGATEIICHMQMNGHKLFVEIEHDGQGLLQENVKTLLESPTGLGMLSIQYRLDAINGSSKYFKRDHKFIVIFEVPAEIKNILD